MAPSSNRQAVGWVKIGLSFLLKGTVTMGDGTTRQLSYQWAFTGDAAERIDTYKFELTQGKGDAENRTISATYRRGEAEGAFSVKGEWSAAIKRGTSTVTTGRVGKKPKNCNKE